MLFPALLSHTEGFQRIQKSNEWQTAQRIGLPGVQKTLGKL